MLHLNHGEVYNNVKKYKYFITNLGKCTQIDARSLPDSVYKKYLSLLEKEIEIINPKVIVLFGNQVSSIVLNQKISVSQCRKQEFIKEINNKEYKCYSVFYPVGNGRFNINKSIVGNKLFIDIIRDGTYEGGLMFSSTNLSIKLYFYGRVKEKIVNGRRLRGVQLSYDGNFTDDGYKYPREEIPDIQREEIPNIQNNPNTASYLSVIISLILIVFFIIFKAIKDKKINN